MVDTAPAPGSGQWILVYPIYFSKERSRADGRRVSRRSAVSAPEAAEVFRVCQEKLSFPALLEPDKKHPRDFFVAGRVKVQLPEEPSDDGALTHTAKRKAVLRAIAKSLQELRRTQAATGSGQKAQKLAKTAQATVPSAKNQAGTPNQPGSGARRKTKR